MDGENRGKPYENGMIWGQTPYFRKHPYTQQEFRYNISTAFFKREFHVFSREGFPDAKEFMAANLSKESGGIFERSLGPIGTRNSHITGLSSH